jgi:DNA repair exonuclease SbcCD ATPase subunit
MMIILAPAGNLLYAQEAEERETEEISIIDPTVYEGIKETTQQRFQDMYQLMFGENLAQSQTSGEGDQAYNGPVITDDTDPEIRNMFIHAWQSMDQAQKQEESNKQAAANSYLRSMKHLRNAYRKYEQMNPELSEELEEVDDQIPEEEIPETPTEEQLDEIQQQLIERYEQRFQERLAQMYENYNNLVDDLSPGDAAKANNALVKAENKLLRIQERITLGQYDEALEELEATNEEMEDDFDSMEDTAAGQMFKTMNKLEERIQKMEEQATRKAARGEDTSEIDALLSELRGNKNKIKDDFKHNNQNGNNGQSGNNSNNGGNSGN